MVVVIVVGDKVINNVGGIRAVTEKWGLSFSVVQRALSGIKEHRQGGRQCDKLAGRPQRRSRKKGMNHEKRMNQMKKLHHHPKSQRPGRGSDQKRLQKRKYKKKNLTAVMMMMITCPMYPCKKRKKKGEAASSEQKPMGKLETWPNKRRTRLKTEVTMKRSD